MKRHEFSVDCVAEIDNHIGKCRAHIVGDSPTDWYIDCITNQYDGEKSGEFVSDRLYAEIAEEVNDYFNNKDVNNE